MALDGIMLKTVTRHLKELEGGRIGKIQNLSDEEILFHIHTKNGLKRLVINVHSNTNRVYLASYVPEIQPEPSGYVMFLRKHFSQGIITSITQAGYDRILVMKVQAMNELGDRRILTLYLELMGKYANLIAVSEEGLIMDALKRIPVFENSRRLIHPGARYELPSQPDKQDPSGDVTIDGSKPLTDQISGFSPLLSREAEHQLHEGKTWKQFWQQLEESDRLYWYDDRHFHIIPLSDMKTEPRVYDLMEGLSQLYRQREEKSRHKEQFGDLIRTVEKEKKKQQTKLPRLQASLEAARDHDKYREYGDLLFAWQGTLKQGRQAVVQDFATGQDITIPLDEKYGIRDNANRYYAKYHKMKRSLDALQEQIRICEEDLVYFEQMEEQLKHCSYEDAREIRQELENGRWLLPKKGARRRKGKSRPHVLEIPFEEATIFAGRNNLQNSWLTHKMARRSDLWFHVKGYHGSHVILQSDDPTESQIRMAAMIAAWFSKGKDSSSVPVDYTQVSQLKKVPGSKAGFVTMKSYRTIYIDPDPKTIEAILRKRKQ
ncbi:NFACT family protein [uncultured Faecalibaculum sp.]|uniref:Rqc2 family fibronectin-binding protein n=1 Tax=uncultured Faecalibaculum sp. TaxID=1729681 RepID=UPI0025F99292|nr:NFACT RNA binding domain-containing protein [uncultured Faecalibaculum sp.]